MKKKKSELVQVIIFLVILAGQIFLASRYASRGDSVGMALFAIIAILAGISVVGHFIEWRKA
jgi:hypothetical protein